MNFSKTAIREWVLAALGFAVMVGIDLPVDQLMDMFDTAWTNGEGFVLMLWAALGLWLRKLTDSPMAQGIKGFFGVKG